MCLSLSGQRFLSQDLANFRSRFLHPAFFPGRQIVLKQGNFSGPEALAHQVGNRAFLGPQTHQNVHSLSRLHLVSGGGDLGDDAACLPFLAVEFFLHLDLYMKRQELLLGLIDREAREGRQSCLRLPHAEANRPDGAHQGRGDQDQSHETQSQQVQKSPFESHMLSKCPMILCILAQPFCAPEIHLSQEAYREPDGTLVLWTGVCL